MFKVPINLRDYVERGIKPTAVRGLNAFKNELNILLNLNHKNIISLIGYGIDPPVLVYEYCELTLRDLMNRGISEAECIKLASSIAEALRFIHSRVLFTVT